MAFRFVPPVGFVIALIMTVIFMVFPKELLSLFNADEEKLSIVISALRIMSVSQVSSLNLRIVLSIKEMRI